MKDDIFTIKFNPNIAKENNDIRIAFYANIGFFIEVAQMLEYNLRKLICYSDIIRKLKSVKDLSKEEFIKFDKDCNDYYFKTYIKKYTLGKIKNDLLYREILESNETAILEEINIYRNLIVHNIFVNNFITNTFESDKNVKDYFMKRLLPMIDKAININEKILNIMNPLRTELHVYKDKFQIPYNND